MIAFIKNCHLDIIRKKLVLLYILNVTDIIFTLLLLQTGFFAEANIFMADVVKNPAFSLFLKVVLPGVFLFYLDRSIRDSDEKGMRLINIGVNISLGIYAFVNLSHILWVSILPFLYRYSI